MAFLIWPFAVVLLAVPFFRIFGRAGFKPWWALLMLVPLVGLFLCWLFLAVEQWKWEKAT